MVRALVLVCLTTSVRALESRSGIELRIDAPFSDLYVGETDYWLMRVENRTKEIIPVPDGGPNQKGEVPPPQFHVQTEAEASGGKNPQASSWEEIESFGNGMKDLVDKSVLVPGQAMEAFSWGLPGQLSTPPQGGKFRIAMQVGPDDFVYSNWITRTRHDEPVQGMRTIRVDDPWENKSECQIQISEGTNPRYLWFCTSGPSNSLLFRICEVPQGMQPEIQIDRERGQYVISFPPGGPPATYFAHRCGVSKSTPWPKGYRSKDFSLTSYPISAPSPIGFPMDLFGEERQTGLNHQKIPITKSEQFGKRMADQIISKSKKSDETDWLVKLVWPMLALLIAGAGIGLIRRKTRSAK